MKVATIGELNAATGSENIIQSSEAEAASTSFYSQSQSGPLSVSSGWTISDKKVRGRQKKYDHHELTTLTQSVG